jgi:hypothetical protein
LIMLIYIKAKLKAAWDYSRTIFINVASFIALGLNAFLTYAVGADWASVIHNPKLLFAVTMAVNVANIYLRFQTTAPVGEKPNEGA